MATNKMFTAATLYDASLVEGIATFTPKEVEAITWERFPALNPESTYVLMRQWVHNTKLRKKIGKYTHSKKVFMVELSGEFNLPIAVLEIPINALRATFFQMDEPGVPMPKIAAIQKKGLWRGTAQASETCFGHFPGPDFRDKGDRVYVAKPLAIKFVRSQAVWQPVFQEVSGGWDMVVIKGEEETYLKLNPVRIKLFSSSLDVPKIDETYLSQKDKDVFNIVTANLPEEK